MEKSKIIEKADSQTVITNRFEPLVIPPPKIKGYIYSDQETLWGARNVVGFGEETFYIKEIERDVANKMIMENHYSKKFYSATYIHLGVFSAENLLGVLQYGYAMNPASQASVVKNTAIDEYLELNRMWLDDSLGRNSESRAISYSIKYIKNRYPKIGWIQSFADERCGLFGIVYQAANFSYCGEHTAVFWEWKGEYYHNTLMTAKKGKQGKIGDILQAHKNEATPLEFRQFRYIYFIRQKKRKDLLLEVRPYPKYYNDTVAV